MVGLAINSWLNSNIEYRNPKQIQIFKIRMTKTRKKFF